MKAKTLLLGVLMCLVMFNFVSADTDISSVSCGATGKQLSIANERYFLSANISLNATCYLNITATGVQVDGQFFAMNATNNAGRMLEGSNSIGLSLSNFTITTRSNISVFNVSSLSLKNINIQAATASSSLLRLNSSGNYITITNVTFATGGLIQCFDIQANHTIIQNSSCTNSYISFANIGYAVNFSMISNNFTSSGASNPTPTSLTMNIQNSSFVSNVFNMDNILRFNLGGNGSIFSNNVFGVGDSVGTGSSGAGRGVTALEGTTWINNTFQSYFFPVNNADGNIPFVTGGNNIYVDGATIQDNSTYQGSSIISISNNNVTIKNAYVYKEKSGTNSNVGALIVFSSGASNVLLQYLTLNSSISGGGLLVHGLYFDSTSSIISNVMARDLTLATIGGNATFLFRAANNITILNTTYPAGKTDQFTASTNVTNFFRSWYYNVYVNGTDSFNLSSVNVTTNNSFSSYSGSTSVFGLASLFLPQYSINYTASSGTKLTFNNYTINASGSPIGYNQTSQTHSVNMSDNYNDYFTFQRLDTTAPIVTITNPSNDLSVTTDSIPYFLSLQYSASDLLGAVDSCWYNVTRTSPTDGVEVATTILPGCNSTTFSVSQLDASYTVQVCANDTFNQIGCDTNSFSTASILIIPGGGGGPNNPSNPILDPQNPSSPLYHSFVPGESTGAPVVVTDGNLSWQMQTDGAGNRYTLLIGKGATREKAIVYINTGTEVVSLNTTCEGSLCPYLIFKDPTLSLPVERDAYVISAFTVNFSTVKTGSFSANIISTDQRGNRGVISISASVSKIGLLVDIFSKLFKLKQIGNIKIPYILFVLLVAIPLFLLLNYLTRRYSFGPAVSFLVTAVVSLSVLAFI